MRKISEKEKLGSDARDSFIQLPTPRIQGFLLLRLRRKIENLNYFTAANMFLDTQVSLAPTTVSLSEPSQSVKIAMWWLTSLLTMWSTWRWTRWPT